MLTSCRLDSRQRKKRHTEELEEEKKHWTEENCSIKTELKELREQFEHLLIEHQGLQSLNSHLNHQVQSLENEKEEMITQHTLESGELRKKISVLKDQLESNPLTHPSHSSDYADFASELEGLNMSSDGGDWTAWVTEFDVDQPQPPPVQHKPHSNETTLVVGQRRKDTLFSDVPDKQMVSGSFLLLFLLYGAFVATRATSSAPIPPMSDEYRHEAALILNHVLDDDGGIQQSSVAMLQGATGIQQVASWAQPSNTQPQARPAFSVPANADNLNRVTQRILTPSKQQEAEAAFSMTPALYNSMVSSDFTRRTYESTEENGEAPTKNTRKSLAELVRANREESDRGSSMAEVYTRSLMWDRIPTEVVQEFKRMVSGCHSDGDHEVKTEYNE
jgi:hypothetical protein